MLSGRRREQGEEAARAITSDGNHALFVAADVGFPDSARNLVETVVREYGRVDTVFACAGVGSPSVVRIDRADELGFDDVMRVNVRGVFTVAKLAFATMVAGGGGSIVICGSVASIRGGSGSACAYYTSKHAVLGLMKQVALDGGPHAIRCNAVLPGVVRTEMLAKRELEAPEQFAKMVERIPMGRMGMPDDIARAVMFLASDDAAYITGTTLVVDGGASV